MCFRKKLYEFYYFDHHTFHIMRFRHLNTIFLEVMSILDTVSHAKLNYRSN